MQRVKNALSIDIEDWYQGILGINWQDWPKYENRLNLGVKKILKILAENKIKATFFILGDVAERHPDIIEALAGAGHEIASHGYAHQLVYKQTQEEFRADVLRSKEVIESIARVKIKGYRAPFFSITRDCLWALDILRDLGFEYDSSVFPTKNFLYGIPDAPQTIYKINGAPPDLKPGVLSAAESRLPTILSGRRDKSGIIEFPLSVIKISGFNLPVCGGFYLRALPYCISRYGIRYFNRRGWPAVVYLHPWELDAGKPKIPMRLKWRLIHEYNIGKMEDKFKRLIKDFSFTSISEVLFGA